MDRRSFLKTSSVVPLLAYMPLGWANGNVANESGTLILVQLGGGNDGLNTFVPYMDPQYYVLRPNIALPSDSVLPLTDNVALHPSLAAFLPAWENGEMALVHGLGYPDPNRSHFRGIEIWQTASDANEYLQSGWLSEVLSSSDEPLEAITISGSPMSTHGASNQFNLAGQTGLDKFKQVYIPTESTDNELLNFIMNSRHQFNDSLTTLSALLAEEVTFDVEFPQTEFGQQCYLLAKLMAQGFVPKVWHLALGSFDTHSNQVNAHSNLLAEMSNGIAALREALIEIECWQKTTVASYCEFGRRVAENGSFGTDHGTAATHFVLGGNVTGGEIGDMPSLDDLDNGDLIFNTDFRNYYQTLLSKAGMNDVERLKGFQELGF